MINHPVRRLNFPLLECPLWSAEPSASPNGPGVEGFIDEFCFQYGIGKDRFGTNTRQYGNLVIPSTLKMLHDDLAGSVIGSGDQVCFTVVGAGPERGAFLLPVA